MISPNYLDRNGTCETAFPYSASSMTVATTREAENLNRGGRKFVLWIFKVRCGPWVLGQRASASRSRRGVVPGGTKRGESTSNDKAFNPEQLG